MSFDLYIHSAQSSPRMEVEGRYGLEDDLEEFLGEAGRLSGAGVGIGSLQWNIDLELDGDEHWQAWVDRVVRFLREWGVPADTELVVLPPSWEPGMDNLPVRVYDEANPYVEVAPPPAEPEEDATEPEPRSPALPQFGDTFLVPLGNNLFGACRVIRIRGGEYASLVAGTDWFGEGAPPLTEVRLRSLLVHTCVGAVGPSCTFWLVGRPPPEFRHLGVIEPSAAEQELTYGQHTHHWSMIAGSLRMEWEWLQKRQE
jgi:hypothetical protein